ncbi:hypothetical protein [Nocardia pseudovaccinii]|uniref:hypothetical protein n=1 Tax=Nocardia pseudovaccinii TaxID=189540 RepID=UPI000AD022E6|nr:hypothetical protein [Nocardia pseudovaccinii]
MSTTGVVCATVAGVVTLGVVVFYVLPHLLDRPVHVDGERPSTEILARIARDQCHRAPDHPYTLCEARCVFRARINCDADSCGAKHEAFWTLVDAGVLRPVAYVER